MYIVYFIKHQISGDIYIGKTRDLKRRLAEHNAGKQISTKRKEGSWNLVYAEAYNAQQDADIRELKLKHHGRAKQEVLKRCAFSLNS